MLPNTQLRPSVRKGISRPTVHLLLAVGVPLSSYEISRSDALCECPQSPRPSSCPPKPMRSSVSAPRRRIVVANKHGPLSAAPLASHATSLALCLVCQCLPCRCYGWGFVTPIFSIASTSSAMGLIKDSFFPIVHALLHSFQNGTFLDHWHLRILDRTQLVRQLLQSPREPRSTSSSFFLWRVSRACLWPAMSPSGLSLRHQALLLPSRRSHARRPSERRTPNRHPMAPFLGNLVMVRSFQIRRYSVVKQAVCRFDPRHSFIILFLLLLGSTTRAPSSDPAGVCLPAPAVHPGLRSAARWFGFSYFPRGLWPCWSHSGSER